MVSQPRATSAIADSICTHRAKPETKRDETRVHSSVATAAYVNTLQTTTPNVNVNVGVHESLTVVRHALAAVLAHGPAASVVEGSGALHFFGRAARVVAAEHVGVLATGSWGVVVGARSRRVGRGGTGERGRVGQTSGDTGSSENEGGELHGSQSAGRNGFERRVKLGVSLVGRSGFFLTFLNFYSRVSDSTYLHYIHRMCN